MAVFFNHSGLVALMLYLASTIYFAVTLDRIMKIEGETTTKKTPALHINTIFNFFVLVALILGEPIYTYTLSFFTAVNTFVIWKGFVRMKKTEEQNKQQQKELEELMKQFDQKEDCKYWRAEDAAEELFRTLGEAKYVLENSKAYVPIEQRLLINEAYKQDIQKQLEILSWMEGEQLQEHEEKVIEHIRKVQGEVRYFIEQITEGTY